MRGRNMCGGWRARKVCTQSDKQNNMRTLEFTHLRIRCITVVSYLGHHSISYCVMLYETHRRPTPNAYFLWAIRLSGANNHILYILHIQLRGPDYNSARAPWMGSKRNVPKQLKVSAVCCLLNRSTNLQRRAPTIALIRLDLINHFHQKSHTNNFRHKYTEMRITDYTIVGCKNRRTNGEKNQWKMDKNFRKSDYHSKKGNTKVVCRLRSHSAYSKRDFEKELERL